MSFTPIGNDVTAAGFLAAGITVFGATGIIVGVRIHNSYVYAKHLFLDDCKRCHRYLWNLVTQIITDTSVIDLAVFAWMLQVANFGVYIQLFRKSSFFQPLCRGTH